MMSQLGSIDEHQSKYVAGLRKPTKPLMTSFAVVLTASDVQRGNRRYGSRYCPSIEDKFTVLRKNSHQIF